MTTSLADIRARAEKLRIHNYQRLIRPETSFYFELVDDIEKLLKIVELYQELITKIQEHIQKESSDGLDDLYKTIFNGLKKK